MVRIAILFLAVGAGALLVNASDRPKDVEQPLFFNHRIHAGENQIPCLYCHVHARRSAVAGVPSVYRCIGCHRIIGKETPDLIKLKEYWTDKESIPWVKVYDLPDFVRFTHKRHILKGIDCEECHGPVKGMDRIEKVGLLTMARCVSCHRERGAGDDCWTCHK